MGKGLQILKEFISLIKKNNELNQSFKNVIIWHYGVEGRTAISEFIEKWGWMLKDIRFESTERLIPKRDFKIRMTIDLDFKNSMPYDFDIYIPIYSNISKLLMTTPETTKGQTPETFYILIKPKTGYSIQINLTISKMPKTWDKIKEKLPELRKEFPIAF
jgi:hypothetical protein